MIPVGIPARQWASLQHAKAVGIQVAVEQFAAQWIAVIDGEVVHIDDAAKVVEHQLARRRARATA